MARKPGDRAVKRKATKSAKTARTARASRRKAARTAPKKAVARIARPNKTTTRVAPRKKAKPKLVRAKTRVASKTTTKAKARSKVKPAAAQARKFTRRPTPARVARTRRILEEVVIPSPPSSLDMNRHGSAARTGRAELEQALANHATMTPSINAGDSDVNIEDAYFVGDEAPGGDNPTPDQDVVDEIGKALGVEYQDAEELRASDKVAQRDKHRWELDPASSEDYRNRK